MKTYPQIKLTLFIVLSLLLFKGSKCDNDDDIVSPIDQLPSATQTGAQTFGCLVNGEAYIDESRSFNAFYQLIDGEYYFNVGASDQNSIIDLMVIATNAMHIQSNTEYRLLCNSPNNFYSEVFLTGELLLETTCNSHYGIITITNFEPENNIVSAEFDFDIIDPRNGERIEIREGRFDVLFNR
ncbi:hypothetical protein SAMN03097699_2789 [Flavobacteriaceae bacterium MAR_2010_188]|nr:hypothetical protein SAMN03097699_2789 [Flavobacteriaceae bacterium MAR_2010_188]